MHLTDFLYEAECPGEEGKKRSGVYHTVPPIPKSGTYSGHGLFLVLTNPQTQEQGLAQFLGVGAPEVHQRCWQVMQGGLLNSSTWLLAGLQATPRTQETNPKQSKAWPCSSPLCAEDLYLESTGFPAQTWGLSSWLTPCLYTHDWPEPVQCAICWA